MAKKLFNPLTLKHMEEEIELIFLRIEAELFAKEYLDIVNQLSLKPKLLHLQLTLHEFKDKLILENRIRKDEFALNTARCLDFTLDAFFYKSESFEKTAIVKQFYNYARQAWFSRLNKTIAMSLFGAGLVFTLSLTLIILTGGALVMGVGSVIGVSVLLSLIGGGVFAFGGYKLQFNDHEARGKEVRDALLQLNDDFSLPTFITKRNHLLLIRPRNVLAEELREKYELKPTSPAHKENVPEKSPFFLQRVVTPAQLLSTGAQLARRFIQLFKPSANDTVTVEVKTDKPVIQAPIPTIVPPVLEVTSTSKLPEPDEQTQKINSSDTVTPKVRTLGFASHLSRFDSFEPTSTKQQNNGLPAVDSLTFKRGFKKK